MAKVKKTKPVKLFFGLLLASPELLPAVERRIRLDFSDIDFKTELIPFEHSDYYNEEMGESIQRCFLSCQSLINMEEIVSIKLHTNDVELLFADSKTGQRRVNIDPGYLSLSKVVLATTKDYDHRIHLNDGIFAEATLRYKRKTQSYQPWEWTYPDYSQPVTIDFFNKLREVYKQQIRSKKWE